MSGRIKLLSNGVPVNPTDDPPLGYDYQTVDNDFDQTCGTWGLSPFQLPHEQCPERFVCMDDTMNSQVTRAEGSMMSFGEFASCIDAMNCHMMTGMTTGGSSGSEAVLFIHQMIPHHQNAVNMAKALLKANTLQCDDLTSEEPNCVLEKVIRSIVVDQNHQIQLMRGYLEALGYNEYDDCVVEVTSDKGTLVGEESTSSSDQTDATSEETGEQVAAGATSILWSSLFASMATFTAAAIAIMWW